MTKQSEDERALGVQSIIDWIAQHFGTPRHEKSFSELSDQYHQALGQREEAYVKDTLLKEWLAGNVELKPTLRRETDKQENLDVSYDEIDDASERGVKMDDVFFARGQHSFEKLWDAQASNQTTMKVEREGPDIDR